MRLLVTESICGGLGGGLVDSSLRREGEAMLAAVVGDFSRVDGCRVVTMWDRQLGPSPFDAAICHCFQPEWGGAGGESRQGAAGGGAGADARSRLFQRLAAECDAVFDIAPELDGLLLARRRMVEAAGGRYLGSSASAIELCGDKLRLAGHLAAHGIPTIDTQLAVDGEPAAFPVVVKRRDGAGSLSMRSVGDRRELDSLRRQWIDAGIAERMIVQPLVEGRHLSVAAVIGERPEDLEIFPAGEQTLSGDGRFTYLGGEIPAAGADQDVVADLVRAASAVLPGLAGYVGFDVIAPAGSPSQPVLVEINPRLTTAYLGYRALAAENIAERLLFPQRQFAPIGWRPGKVRFTAEG